MIPNGAVIVCVAEPPRVTVPALENPALPTSVTLPLNWWLLPPPTKLAAVPMLSAPFTVVLPATALGPVPLRLRLP